MTGWLIALGVLLGLAILPLGVQLRYDADGFLARIIVGFIKITIFPQNKKEKPPKKERKSTKKPGDNPSQKPPKPEKTGTKGGSLRRFLPLAEPVLEFLSEFRRKLRVRRLELKLIMAGDDPCKLALGYGAAWAATGNLIPLLERAFLIKKRNIEIQCDFTADETKIIGNLELTITLGRLLVMAARYGLRGLRVFTKIKKGGA